LSSATSSILRAFMRQHERKTGVLSMSLR
jgi:hypothetical protein